MSKSQKAGEASKSSSPSPVLFFVVAAIATLAGTYSAYQMRWACDDIFITLRYVENWLAGNGIVYNVGERVEGYTHFLWMCLIALFQWLGANPVEISKTLGWISYGATLLVWVLISARSSEKKLYLLPLTAIILALHFDFKVWSTSGLETSFFTLLVSLSLFTMTFWRSNEKSQLLTSGLLLTLAVLTRPDGVLFYGVAALFVLVRLLAANKPWNQVIKFNLLFHAAFVLIYIPYFLWKYSYYGDIFPNTYYAKSGGLSYYSQGFYYLWVYFKAYLSSFIILFSVVALVGFLRTIKEVSRGARFREAINDPGTAFLLLSLAYTIVYGVFFIARVGGDFMYARFLHPLIPIIYGIGEVSLRKQWSKKTQGLLAAFVLLSLLPIYEKTRRDSLFIEENGKRKGAFELSGITDEYWYWTQTETFGVDPIKMNEFIGRQLEQYFRGEKVSVLLRGQASLGYYAKFSGCIENAGLADAYVAHLPLENRARPGHEKNAPVEYLVGRGVNFVFFRSPYDTAYYRTVNFRLGGGYGKAEMFVYDRALMQHLKQRFPADILFVDFESYLDNYLRTIKSRSRGEVERDYAKFKGFYFLHNSDPEREKAFLQFLGNQPS